MTDLTWAAHVSGRIERIRREASRDRLAALARRDRPPRCPLALRARVGQPR